MLEKSTESECLWAYTIACNKLLPVVSQIISANSPCQHRDDGGRDEGVTSCHTDPNESWAVPWVRELLPHLRHQQPVIELHGDALEGALRQPRVHVRLQPL